MAFLPAAGSRAQTQEHSRLLLGQLSDADAQHLRNLVDRITGSSADELLKDLAAFGFYPGKSLSALDSKPKDFLAYLLIFLEAFRYKPGLPTIIEIADDDGPLWVRVQSDAAGTSRVMTVTPMAVGGNFFAGIRRALSGAVTSAMPGAASPAPETDALLELSPEKGKRVVVDFSNAVFQELAEALLGSQDLETLIQSVWGLRVVGADPFSKRELLALIKILSDLPDHLVRSMKLKTLRRLAHGKRLQDIRRSTDPYFKINPAHYVPDEETIEFTDEFFYADRSYVLSGIAHELGHAVWHGLPDKLQKRYSKISWEWGLFSGWDPKESAEDFVTPYSQINREEDFAEHFSYFYTRSDELLKPVFEKKRTFFQKKIFGETLYRVLDTLTAEHRDGIVDTEAPTLSIPLKEAFSAVQSEKSFEELGPDDEIITWRFHGFSDAGTGVSSVVVCLLPSGLSDYPIGFCGDSDVALGTFVASETKGRYGLHEFFKRAWKRGYSVKQITLIDRAGNERAISGASLGTFFLKGLPDPATLPQDPSRSTDVYDDEVFRYLTQSFDEEGGISLRVVSTDSPPKYYDRPQTKVEVRLRKPPGKRFDPEKIQLGFMTSVDLGDGPRTVILSYLVDKDHIRTDAAGDDWIVNVFLPPFDGASAMRLGSVWMGLVDPTNGVQGEIAYAIPKSRWEALTVPMDSTDEKPLEFDFANARFEFLRAEAGYDYFRLLIPTDRALTAADLSAHVWFRGQRGAIDWHELRQDDQKTELKISDMDGVNTLDYTVAFDTRLYDGVVSVQNVSLGRNIGAAQMKKSKSQPPDGVCVSYLMGENASLFVDMTKVVIRRSFLVAPPSPEHSSLKDR